MKWVELEMFTYHFASLLSNNTVGLYIIHLSTTYINSQLQMTQTFILWPRSFENVWRIFIFKYIQKAVNNVWAIRTTRFWVSISFHWFIHAFQVVRYVTFVWLLRALTIKFSEKVCMYVCMCVSLFMWHICRCMQHGCDLWRSWTPFNNNLCIHILFQLHENSVITTSALICQIS